MLNIFKSLIAQRQGVSVFKSVARLGLSIAIISFPFASVESWAAPKVKSGAIAAATNLSAGQTGVYLFGATQKPDQLKQEYFVFEIKNNRVIGAFFMPQSSFDCFSGSINSGKLDLKITDSYDQAAYPYSVNLQDYQAITRVSANDQRLLKVCKAADQTQQAQALKY